MKTGVYQGTSTLVLLALKRDRIRLLAWILGIAVLTGMMIAAFSTMLPAEEDIINMTTVHASNPVMRLFLAPASGVSIGGFVMMRVSTVIALVIAFFSVLTVTRHTRHNEETGCEELTGSTVVGRHASLLASLIVTVASNILLAALVAIAFMINGQPAGGSFAAGVALGAVGIAFAGAAAITAQLTETTRGANGMAAMAIGIMFMLSGIGNTLGEFKPLTLEVISAWPVWLSPFGWYQQIHAFHQNNWWIILLFAVLLTICVKTAFILNSRRDVGMGMIPARRGPAAAPARLLSPIGLAWRIQHRLFITWSITVVVFGTILGSMIGEFTEKMSELERADQIFGDIFSMNETLVMALMAMLGPFVAFYTVQAFLRMVSEEANGLAEPVLATAVTRLRWIMSHTICIFAGTVIILMAWGLGGAVSAIVEADERWYKAIEAALIQAPAVLVFAGFSLLVFGMVPRLSAALSWVVLIVSLLAGPFLGPALDLPQWIQNVSPFTHVPGPTEAVTAAPMIVLLLIAAVFTAGGLVSFTRRSIRTEH